MNQRHSASLGNVCPGGQRRARNEIDSGYSRQTLTLEEHIKQSMVGQQSAITAVVEAIERRESNWLGDKRPLVLLFLGSSGIGKTELAKQIAEYKNINHNNNNKKKNSNKLQEYFIRVDMSEYQQQHEVAKLIGSPPGYSGHEKGGQLTSKLAECPNAVVLFDEVEKAHNDVLTILLQLFDEVFPSLPFNSHFYYLIPLEGRLTDGMGKTIACEDATFIMTSNLATDEIVDYGKRIESGTGAQHFSEFKVKTVEPILKRHFKRDEFLGRINKMVYFLPFSRLELRQLVVKNLKALKKNARTKRQMKVLWDERVVDIVANKYQPQYGARSVKNAFDETVVEAVQKAFKTDLIKNGDTFVITVEENTSEIKIELHEINHRFEELLRDSSRNDRMRLINDTNF